MAGRAGVSCVLLRLYHGCASQPGTSRNMAHCVARYRQVVPAYRVRMLKSRYLLIGGAGIGVSGITFWSFAGLVASSDDSNYAAAVDASAIIADSATGRPFKFKDTNERRRSHGWIRFFNVIFRVIRLGFTFVPLIVIYPLALCTKPSLELWWRLVYIAVRHSGATVIKLAQWAATRRDLFSAEFCHRFSHLQRSAGQQPFAETERVLVDTFGPEWRLLFRQFDQTPIGSGCVAQVYKAAVNPYELMERLDGQPAPTGYNQAYIPVAIKITHDSVIDTIQTDMDILESAARLVQFLLPSVSYLKPLNSLDDFRQIMEQQVDLRHECCALKCFAYNFRHNECIKFPTPMYCTERLLIETFEEGLHVSNFIPEPGATVSEESRHLNEHLALTGVSAVCQMIFNDNFVHGDLHPGNILVQNTTTELTGNRLNPLQRIRRKWNRLTDRVMALFSTDRRAIDEYRTMFAANNNGDEDNPMPKLVFVDTGITVQLTRHDLVNFRAAFKALLNLDGQEIGELLLNHAPQGQQWCQDRQAFRNDIEALLQKATNGKKTIMFAELNLSEVLSSLLSIVSTHKVCLVPQYACVLLAVIVLEGLGRSLYPKLDVLQVSRPFVFSAIVAHA